MNLILISQRLDALMSDPAMPWVVAAMSWSLVALLRTPWRG